MKFVLIVALAVFSVSSFAADNLQNMKTQANDNITKRISTLEEARGCINGASTVDAFKACKYDMSGGGMKMQKEEVKGDMNKMEDNTKSSM